MRKPTSKRRLKARSKYIRYDSNSPITVMLPMSLPAGMQITFINTGKHGIVINN